MSVVAPQERLWNLIRGALGTKAFGIVADLGIADALASGPRPIADLAQETGANGDTLHRLLRALASDGVFAEVEPGVFTNTEASELLRQGNQDRWPEFAHLFSEVCFPAIAALDAHDTEVAFRKAYRSDFWSWLAEHPSERSNFDRAMEGGRAELADRLATLDWRAEETVVDIGGGSGTLLRELLARRPELHGIVFDLPETTRDEASLGDRITFVAGSFFETAPTGDVYLLSKILHDWDDDAAGQILRCIRAAAGPSARLLVLDAVVPSGNEPAGVKWLDILMLVLQRGRERSESAWRSLLGATGFGIDMIEDGLIQASCR